MRGRTPVALVVATLGLLAQGCATIISGPNQNVPVFTNPPGATVTAGGQRIVSPGVLKLPRKDEGTTVTIELDGYETKTFVMSRKDNGLTLLDAMAVPVGAASGAVAAGAAGGSDGTEVFEGATLLGGLLGAILAPGALVAVDYATGAAYKLEPKQIAVRLTPAVAPSRSESP